MQYLLLIKKIYKILYDSGSQILVCVQLLNERTRKIVSHL